ncbi:hypothetical protein ACIQHY_15300 [Streptomyces sp. NPDC092359]|uniref:hypothetical protein n=1 Tax=Streptomyces sp. NPDC092359 TaxID=3366014 RepID=UPI00380336BE
MAWTETAESSGVAHRYGVIGALLGAGVDPARTEVFHDPEGGGVYWVVTLGGGHTAVLTDDTEEHVGHLEGPWPFKALFLGPEGIRTKIGPSIEGLTADVARWHAETVGPRDESR